MARHPVLSAGEIGSLHDRSGKAGIIPTQAGPWNNGPLAPAVLIATCATAINSFRSELVQREPLLGRLIINTFNVSAPRRFVPFASLAQRQMVFISRSIGITKI